MINKRKDKTQKKLDSDIIATLRFPLAVLIVYWHMNPQGIPLVDSSNIFSTESVKYVLEVGMSGYFVQFAVPLFFILSGYLFFLNMPTFNMGGYRDKLKRRIKTLFIPYISWTCIALLINIVVRFIGCVLHNKSMLTIIDYLKEVIPNGFYVVEVTTKSYSNILGVNYLEFLPLVAPLWFIRDLMIMVLLTPILYWLIKILGEFFIILLVFIFLTGIWPPIPGLDVRTVTFFSIGAYWAINGYGFVCAMRSYKNIAFVVNIPAFIACVYLGKNNIWGMFFLNMYILSACCIAVYLCSYIVENNSFHIPELLVKSTFFIYAMHTVFIMGWFKTFISKVLPYDNFLIDIIKFYTTPILIVIFIVFIYKSTLKYLPSIASTLSGGR